MKVSSTTRWRPLRKRVGATMLDIRPIEQHRDRTSGLVMRWAATCEQHGESREYATKTEARRDDPREWCGGCQAETLL